MHDNATLRADALARLTARTGFGNCWLIVDGKLNGIGYFSTTFHGRRTRAHTLGWFIATGMWPTGDQRVCHTCDDASCWRNDEVGTYEVDGIVYERRGHLWLGTTAANMKDCDLKGRRPAGAAHWRTTKPERAAIGERHGQAVLTPKIVREMRARYTSGESITAIAKAYAVNDNVARCAVLRKTWRHVE
jgi:hypothetical protein